MQWIDFQGQRVELWCSQHAGGDDLLSGGLGLEGLRGPLPVLAGELPTRSELRLRALHSNWNGIAWLGDADWSARLPAIPGREVHALLRLPGCRHPQRVMLQIPEHFDPRRPVLLASAASGSRGVYGSIALAGAWGLPRGFAVITTDKACGTDWYDQDSATAPGLDGLPTDDPQRMAFCPSDRVDAAHAVLTRHAHSGEHPESRWGEMLAQAIDFSWAVLQQLFPQPTPLRSRGRTLAVGLSNGGAAVLRALQQADAGIDGAVAAAPNVLPATGGRAFFDYAIEAAVWMPLAHLDVRLQDAPCPRIAPPLPARAALAADALRSQGLLSAGDVESAAGEAYRHLRRRGWSARSLRACRLSTAFDFWGAAVATYAPALARLGASRHPLRCHFAALDHEQRARASSASERALWWSDGAGIVPGAGLGIVSALDPLQRLQAIAGLRKPGHPLNMPLARGLRAIHCAAPAGRVPLLLLHGEDDGLIPPDFCSRPWVRGALAAGVELAAWWLPGAAHFDAHLGLPGYGEHYRPLLPFVFEALDAVWARVERGQALPAGPSAGR